MQPMYLEDVDVQRENSCLVEVAEIRYSEGLESTLHWRAIGVISLPNYIL